MSAAGPFAFPRWRRRGRAVLPRTGVPGTRAPAAGGAAAEAGSEAEAGTPAAPPIHSALGDGISGEPLFHALKHIRRYRVLYGLGAAWIVALAVIQPLDRASPTARPPRLASAAPSPAGPAVSPSPPPAAAAPTPATPAPDSGAALSTYGATTPPAVSDTGSAGSAYPPSPDSPPPSSPPPDQQPPPPPAQSPKCSADANLPAPVAATAVGGLQQAQQGVAQATGQPPPVDAAGTAGQAAGCSSGPSTPTAATAGRPSPAPRPWAWLGPLPVW